jgi:hypothetical protein
MARVSEVGIGLPANTIGNQKPSEWRERFWRRPALRAGRRPHKIPPIRIQKLFASSLNGVEVLEAIGGLLEVG